ncbi:hypothetical protein [Streptomyces noursei]|uniref:hypothetical protein n=1 Tax=Streptomyces noursei TaxID=1971 RepID=UPI0030B81676
MFGGVTCAPGVCSAEAKSVKRQPGHSEKGRPEARPPSEHTEPDDIGAKSPSGIDAYDWQHGLAKMGLVNAGKGLLPRVDGEESDDPQADAKEHVPVRVVVQRAVSRLKLPKPAIHTSPREDFAQVVNVPTWMWVEHGAWGPVTTSAAVEGVEVTATARPRRAVWSMGDGGSVVCLGPGTPYSARFGPKASSPDCGYTYRRASTSEPGKAFPVSVRVVWDVEWEGGGRSGVVPGLAMSAQRRLEVDEVQAVVTG